jgi:hypothetical protein
VSARGIPWAAVMTALYVILIWIALSLPIAIFVGKVIASAQADDDGTIRPPGRAGCQSAHMIRPRRQPKGNPPRGTVLMLSPSADHFSDLRGHSYERSYDGHWATGGGFDGTGTAPPVECRSEAGDCRGIRTLGLIWGCGCAAVRDLDGSPVHMAPTGSWVAGAYPVIGGGLYAGGGRAGG